jgi:hypothetical protein
VGQLVRQDLEGAGQAPAQRPERQDGELLGVVVHEAYEAALEALERPRIPEGDDVQAPGRVPREARARHLGQRS